MVKNICKISVLAWLTLMFFVFSSCGNKEFTVLNACTQKPSVHAMANTSSPDSIPPHFIFYGEEYEAILGEEYEAYLEKLKYRQNEAISREEYEAFEEKVKYRENEVFLKKNKANLSDSIPIAEYCVVYEREGFCNIHDDIDSTETYDTANVYLRREKVLQEQPRIKICDTTDKDIKANYNWANKFFIHNNLKAEKNGCEISFFENGFQRDSHGDIKHYFTIVEWHFAYKVPIYAKDKISFDLNKYSKYYAKGKIIPVEWKLYAKCNSSETTYSGSYFVRITGECPKEIKNSEK